MLTFLLVLLVMWLLWPVMARKIFPAMQRWLVRRAVNQFAKRAGFGTPPPYGGKEAKKGRGAGKHKSRGSATASGNASQEPIIPKDYAVDVEFTEVRTYSEEVDINPSKVAVKTEDQVSDAEIIEIKKEK